MIESADVTQGAKDWDEMQRTNPDPTLSDAERFAYWVRDKYTVEDLMAIPRILAAVDFSLWDEFKRTTEEE